MRDINKMTANANIPEEYQLTTEEWIGLEKEAKEHNADAAYDAVLKSFKYGFVLGQKAEQARKKKTA